MTILVCPLSRVSEMVALHSPGRVISLLDPEWPFPDLGPRYAGLHLRLGFHDVHVAADDEVAPAAEHVAELIHFLSAWTRRDPLLIHCRAGISRSTAAAFVAACLANPHAREHEIAVALRRAAPVARPNETLVRLADNAMGRSGRMSEAIARTGRGLSWIDIDEGLPFKLESAYDSRATPSRLGDLV